jgi:hypothetical protein
VEQYAVATAVKDLFPRYVKAITLPPPKQHHYHHNDYGEASKPKGDVSLKDKIEPKVKERPGMDL